MTYEQFAVDKKTLNAVLRSIEVIGEAVKHVPEEIRQRYPDIPWKEMAGMRDKVIHFYFGVDTKIVWNSITERIPAIQTRLQTILEEVEKAEA
ncbi:MAG: hypothetical protein KatS3mg022_1484 [Armatimonadota bacterium]|nr:MAG: hypothetical protein KatS3mg022_1484 [Armatimonadota bacterium]